MPNIQRLSNLIMHHFVLWSLHLRVQRQTMLLGEKVLNMGMYVCTKGYINLSTNDERSKTLVQPSRINHLWMISSRDHQQSKLPINQHWGEARVHLGHEVCPPACGGQPWALLHTALLEGSFKKDIRHYACFHIKQATNVTSGLCCPVLSACNLEVFMTISTSEGCESFIRQIRHSPVKIGGSIRHAMDSLEGALGSLIALGTDNQVIGVQRAAVST